MEPETKRSDEVIEVEVERLPLEEELERHAPGAGQRVSRALSPLLAGVLIDVIDAGTFGPVGIKLGLIIGGIAGYWLAGELGLRGKHRAYAAAGAAVYCMVPGTSIVPLGTLLGALSRLLTPDSGKASG